MTLPNGDAATAGGRRRVMDPTHPNNWPAQQERGRAVFELKYGLLALGLPLALLFDLVVVVLRGDLPIYFSAHHAVQLGLFTLAIAPVAGLTLGRMLWRIGERRHGDQILTRAFMGDDPAEQRRPPIGQIPVSGVEERTRGA